MIARPAQMPDHGAYVAGQRPPRHARRRLTLLPIEKLMEAALSYKLF
jgi:hypothetical protein